MSIDISVIIPVNNEEPTLVSLAEALDAVLTPLNSSFELIFVDDGSTDGSWKTLEALCDSKKHIVAIKLRKNFRKAAALAVGFTQARGTVVVTIDGDLQDDPHAIPKLLEKIEEVYDLVSGWKQERKDAASKVFASRIFNAVTARLTGVPLHDFNNGLKAYRREVVKNLKLYGDLHRFIPVLASQYGYAITEVPVAHHPRKFGKSHFGGFRLLEGFLDLFTVIFVTQFLQKPSRFFGFAALVAALATLAITIAGLLYATLSIPSWVILAVIGLGVSAQLFSTSIMAEMVRHLLYRRNHVHMIAKKLNDGS